MDKESQILVLRDNAKHELLQIATIEQGLTYLNKVKALETWAEAEKKDAELSLILAEQRVRTQGTIGRLIKEAQDSGELLKNGERKTIRNQYVESAAVGRDNSSAKSLDEIGIARSEVSKYKRIASIPQDKFEEFIAEKKEAGERPSTKAAVRLADEIAGKSEVELRVEYQQKIAKKTAIDDRIAEMLREINKWPKLYREKIKQGIK